MVVCIVPAPLPAFLAPIAPSPAEIWRPRPSLSCGWTQSAWSRRYVCASSAMRKLACARRGPMRHGLQAIIYSIISSPPPAQRSAVWPAARLPAESCCTAGAKPTKPERARGQSNGLPRPCRTEQRAAQPQQDRPTLRTPPPHSTGAQRRGRLSSRTGSPLHTHDTAAPRRSPRHGRRRLRRCGSTFCETSSLIRIRASRGRGGRTARWSQMPRRCVRHSTRRGRNSLVCGASDVFCFGFWKSIHVTPFLKVL